MTDINDIWEEFRSICKYDSDEIPQNDKEIYAYFKSAIKKYNQLAKTYNNRLQGNLVLDLQNEQIDKKLTETEIMIIANIIAWQFSLNKYVEFTSVWGVYVKETGLKDYKAQCNARENVINSYKEEYENLIMSMTESLVMGD